MDKKKSVLELLNIQLSISLFVVYSLYPITFCLTNIFAFTLTNASNVKYFIYIFYLIQIKIHNLACTFGKSMRGSEKICLFHLSNYSTVAFSIP